MMLVVENKNVGVSTPIIPDFLLLLGDSADGWAWHSGQSGKQALSNINQYGAIEILPKENVEGATANNTAIQTNVPHADRCSAVW